LKRGGTEALLAAGVAALVLLRLVAAARLPLLDDEAYYWLWSLRPDWGYLDHPPLIAWLIYAGTRISDTPGWIRAMPLLCGVLTTYVLFLFARDLFGRRTALLAALVAAATVGVTGGSVLATPDTPLLFAWVFTARAVWRAVHGHPRWWALAGVGLGIGLLGKLSILWLAAGLAWYLAAGAHSTRSPVASLLTASGRDPRGESNAGPLLALAIALVISSPLLVWNATHDWATIRFTLTQRPVHLPPGLVAAADLLGAQFIYALTLFPVFVWALWAAWRRRGDARFRYLFWSAVPAVAVPLAMALVTGTHRNAWMGPSYLILAVAVAALWPATRSEATWGNRFAAAATGISVAAAVGLGALLLGPGIPPGSESLYGWDRAGRRAAAEVMDLRQPAVIASDRYQTAAQVAYATSARVAVTLLPEADPESIWTWLWGPSARWRGRDAIVVVDPEWPAPDWRRYASRVTALPPLAVRLAPGPPRTFLFYRLEGLRPSTAR
jgi:4-amino-4-deoxy-L-arabinose transferase-like glycosyltransferase